MSKRTIALAILSRLESQQFADWYNSGDFDDWITGDMAYEQKITSAEAKEKILGQIEETFLKELTT
jgi:hypothetical protein